MFSEGSTVQPKMQLSSEHQYNVAEEAQATAQHKKVCPICKKILPLKSNLSFHMMLHPVYKPFACDFCLHVFKTKDELWKHNCEEHLSELPNMCKICGKVFQHRQNLRRHHILNHSSELKYKCIFCDVPFKEYLQYRNHEATHNQVTAFQCRCCEVYFESDIALDKHAEKRQCENQELSCCDLTFTTRKDFVKHALQKHKRYSQGFQKCKFCGKTFAFLYNKTIHEEQCKANKSEIPGGKTETDSIGNICHRCELCGRVFNTHRGLLKHSRNHEEVLPDKKFNCTECSKTLSSYHALYVHKKRHSKIKDHFCEFCGKGFYSRAAMISHKVVHTKEKPFKCRFCDKRFPFKPSMLGHETLHTGERPFPCSFCDMKFSRFSGKQNHERRHTGEKPYSCTICGKAFLQHSTWKQHERTHSDSNECEHCRKEFTTRKEYKMHRRGGQCKKREETLQFEIVEEGIAVDQSLESTTRVQTETNVTPYLYIIT